MALAAKKIADPEFKVPSLADASPHYAELIERKANLLASKLEAETQLSRDQVAFRARPSQMSEKVAVLVGDVAPGESTYPTAIRMREQATNIAALAQAITVIDTRINSERGNSKNAAAAIASFISGACCLKPSTEEATEYLKA